MISGARSRRGPCERISGHRRGGVRRSPKTKESGIFSDLPRTCPRHFLGRSNFAKSLILLVGAPGFEPGTPSPPDWCANRAALRSEPDSNHNGNRLKSQ
jgi:hypothetical protein